jgi:asparagine synthase (glutamine-hydrolysing)
VGGILGKLSFDFTEPLARPVLEQMLASLRHRGSVGSGLYFAPGIALGWCDRHVPQSVEAEAHRSIHVVADASLTNRPELRRELERQGQRVRGGTDADLIAHAYDAWGETCVEHLRGPFACAIWDDARRRLLLARDRVGIKPLFFAVLHGHGVVFASEIQTLLRDPGVGREWCPQAIDAYLALGYVPAPLSVYQRISKLESAQRLIVEGRRLHVERYWELPDVERIDDDAAIAEALNGRLRTAMLDESNGPGAAILYSGGLASSAILTAADSREHPVITVAGHDDAAALARTHASATHLGLDPIIEAGAPDVRSLAQEVATLLDEPLADPRAIAQHFTFMAARQHATAVIAGHGAATFWAQAAPHGSIGGLAAAVPGDANARYHRRLWDGERRRELYTRSFAWRVQDANPFAGYVESEEARGAAESAKRAGQAPPVRSMRTRAVEARTILPDCTLAIAERAATAAGLELRLPYLDPSVIDLSLSWQPASDRRFGPLEALVARRLPHALLPAPRSGHVYPWLAPAVARMAPEFLLGRRFDGRGLFSRRTLQQLWDEHTSHRHDHSLRLWSLLMLEFWFREFIDGDAVDEPFAYAILRAA